MQRFVGSLLLCHLETTWLSGVSMSNCQTIVLAGLLRSAYVIDVSTLLAICNG